MTKMARLFLVLLAFFALPGMTTQTRSEHGNVSMIQTQPADERAAQNGLPKSKDPIWKTIGTTKIAVNEKKGIYLATFPDDVKKLNGQTLAISGFMLPLDAAETVKHFLLSKRTPTCPFCPPGEPNEVVEVTTTRPIAYTENLVTIEGTFSLADEEEAGIFFKLSDAAKK